MERRWSATASSIKSVSHVRFIFYVFDNHNKCTILTPSLLSDSCRKTSTCCKSTWYSARLQDWRQRSSYIHNNHKNTLKVQHKPRNLQIALHTEAFLSGRLSERWPSLFLFIFDAMLCSTNNMLVSSLSYSFQHVDAILKLKKTTQARAATDCSCTRDWSVV